jgi:hypothetical protein
MIDIHIDDDVRQYQYDFKLEKDVLSTTVGCNGKITSSSIHSGDFPKNT